MGLQPAVIAKGEFPEEQWGIAQKICDFAKK
jgi:hypothetical protein